MEEQYLKVIGEPISVLQKRLLLETQRGLLNAVTEVDFYKLMAIYKEIAERYEVD